MNAAERQNMTKFIVEELDAAGQLEEVLGAIPFGKKFSAPYQGMEVHLPRSRDEGRQNLVKNLVAGAPEASDLITEKWLKLHPVVAPMIFTAALHHAAKNGGWKLEREALTWLALRLNPAFEHILWVQERWKGPRVDAGLFQSQPPLRGLMLARKHTQAAQGTGPVLLEEASAWEDLCLELLPLAPASGRPSDQVAELWRQRAWEKAAALAQEQGYGGAPTLALLAKRTDLAVELIQATRSEGRAAFELNRVGAAAAVLVGDDDALTARHQRALDLGERFPPWDLLMGLHWRRKGEPILAALAFLDGVERGCSVRPVSLACAVLDEQGITVPPAVSSLRQRSGVRPEERHRALEALREIEGPRRPVGTALQISEEVSAGEADAERPGTPSSSPVPETHAWSAIGELHAGVDRLAALLREVSQIPESRHKDRRTAYEKIEVVYAEFLGAYDRLRTEEHLPEPEGSPRPDPEECSPLLLHRWVDALGERWVQRVRARADARARTLRDLRRRLDELGIADPGDLDDQDERSLDELRRVVDDELAWRSLQERALEGRASLSELLDQGEQRCRSLLDRLLGAAANLPSAAARILLELIGRPELQPADLRHELAIAVHQVVADPALIEGLLYAGSRVSAQLEEPLADLLFNDPDILGSQWVALPWSEVERGWGLLGQTLSSSALAELARNLARRSPASLAMDVLIRLLSLRSPEERAASWACWLLVAMESENGSLALIDQAGALAQLRDASLACGRQEEAVLAAVAGHKAVGADELIAGLWVPLLEVARRRADQARLEGWLEELLSEARWLLERPGGSVAFLDLLDRVGDASVSGRFDNGRDWQAMDRAERLYPVLVREQLRRSSRRGDNGDTHQIASEALRRLELSLERQSAYAGFRKEGPRLQREIRRRFERWLKPVLEGGAKAAQRVSDEIEAIESADLVHEIEVFDIEGTALEHLCTVIDGQIEALRILIRAQLTEDTPDLRALLDRQAQPLREKLRHERASAGVLPPVVASVYARALGEPFGFDWSPTDAASPGLRLLIDRVALVQWAEALNPDPQLLPVDGGGDEGESSLVWLVRWIETLAGRRTVGTVVQEYVEKEAFAHVAELLGRLTPPEAEDVLARWRALVESVNHIRADLLRAARTLVGEIDARPDERQALLRVMEEVEHTGPLDLSASLTVQTAASLEVLRGSTTRGQGELKRVRHEIETRRAGLRTYCLDALQGLNFNVIERLREEGDQPHRRSLEGVLMVAPRLALSGDQDGLAALELAIESNAYADVQEILVAAPARVAGPTQPSSAGRSAARSPLNLTGLRLSSYAREEVTAIQPELFPEAGATAQRCRERALQELGRLRRAHVLLAGGLARGTPDDHISLLAEGLSELAAHRVELRRYNQAGALGRDALRYLARLATSGQRLLRVEHQALGALILSRWVPSLPDPARQEQVRREIDRWRDDLPGLLGRIRAEDSIQVVLDAWEGLDQTEAETLTWQLISEADPEPIWASTLLQATLSPARALREPGRAARRTVTLVLSADAPEAVELTADLLAALSAFAPGEDPNSADRERLQQVFLRLGDACASSPVMRHILEEAVRGLLLGSAEIGEEPVEPRVSFNVVGEALYLDELNAMDRRLKLPVELRVQAGAARDLSVELDSGMPGVRPVRAEVGSVEPGLREVVVAIPLPESLATGKIVTRVRLFQGVVPLRSSDGKERTDLRVDATRPGRKQSPFVTGNPLSPESQLFVGRQSDVEHVLKALRGQSQDNVPLVLGSRRIGKTSLLKRVCGLQEIRQNYVPVLVDLETLKGSDTLATVCRRLVEEAADAAEKVTSKRATFEPGLFDEDPARALKRGLEAVLREAGGRRVLLLLDEFEKALQLQREGEERQRQEGRPLTPREALLDITPALRAALHHVTGLSLVISGTPNIRDAFQGEGQRLFGNTLPVRLRTLLPDDLKALLEATQREMALSTAAQDRLARLTGLHPYLLQVVLHHLFNHLPETGRRTLGVGDVEQVIRADILPQSTFFTDLLAVASRTSDGVPLLRALTSAHRQARSTRFVSVEAVAHALVRQGELVEVDDVQSRLEQLARPEAGLVERAPNDQRRWRLTMELIGEHLLAGEGA